MKQRCDVPTNESYERYGGRGISYCAAWSTWEPFRDWALAHGYVKGLYLDRQNNDGNYEPDNCRWVTSAVSAFNRPNTKLAEADVLVIRYLISLGNPLRRIAALYRINERIVSNIKVGAAYGHIQPEVF